MWYKAELSYAKPPWVLDCYTVTSVLAFLKVPKYAHRYVHSKNRNCAFLTTSHYPFEYYLCICNKKGVDYLFSLAKRTC